MPTLEELAAQRPPRPTRMQQRPVHSKLAAEHDRFMEMLPELMKTLKGKWIALHEGEIVAVGDDEVDVLTEAGEKQPGILHHACLVTDQPIPIDRLPLLREVVRGTAP